MLVLKMGGPVAASSSVQVFLRMRPLLACEKSKIEYAIDNNLFHLIAQAQPPSKGKKTYNGMQDYLLEETTNSDIFKTCLESSLAGVLASGHKACVFSYGHTGSGKTHTIPCCLRFCVRSSFLQTEYSCLVSRLWAAIRWMS